MRLTLPLLLVVAVTACTDAPTSPAAPAGPSPFRVSNPGGGFPPPPPISVNGSFQVDGGGGFAATNGGNYPPTGGDGNGQYAGLMSTPFGVDFLFNLEHTGGYVAFDDKQPSGTVVTRGATITFLTNGTLTGRGALALTLVQPRGLGLTHGDGQWSYTPPPPTVIIDLARALDDRNTVVYPSCNAPDGPSDCVVIPVPSALLIDAATRRVRTVSGRLLVHAPEGRPVGNF